MISDIAWENIRWIQESIFDRWEHYGGKLIAVDSFRPFFKKSWINRLTYKSARHRFTKELMRWAEVASHERLFTPEYFTDYSEDPPKVLFDRNVPLFHGEMTELYWFLLRAHYNLYCLSTHRKTIEELAIGAYAYCSKTEKHTEKFDRDARADFRRLLRLSNSFLLAEWVHDMIERAISNNDEAFFRILSNAVKKNIMTDPSPVAPQWLLVILLWFMGGKDMSPRREFLHLLTQEGIFPKKMNIDQDEFRSQLASFGLTKA